MPDLANRSPLYAFDYLFDLFFLFDMVLGALYFAYTPKDSFSVVKLSAEIFPFYARTWLPYDLAATLPLELLALPIVPAVFGQLPGAIVNLLSMFRLNRMLRLVHLGSYWDDMQVYLERISFAHFRGLRLINVSYMVFQITIFTWSIWYSMTYTGI